MNYVDDIGVQPLDENDIYRLIGGKDAMDQNTLQDTQDPYAAYTDEELMQFVNQDPYAAYAAYTDEELFAIAGVEPQEPGLLDKVGAYGRAALTKPMLGGSFADEFLAVPATIGTTAYRAATGQPIQPLQDYQSNLQNIEAQFNQDRQIAPVATFAGDVAGDIRTGLGVANLGAKALGPTSVARLSKYARANPLPTAASIGTVSGGIYGAGASDGGLQERAQAGAMGGAIGGALGPIGARAGQTLSPLLERAQKLLKPSKAAPTTQARALEELATEAQELTLKNAPTAEAQALKKVKNAIEKDFPGKSEEVYQAWLSGDNALIESYGSRARTLGQGAAQYPSGKAVAQKYFGETIPESPEKIKQAIAKNISAEENYYKTADDILAAGRAKAAPVYDEAFKANKSINSKEIDNILSTPAGRKALKDTAKVMQNDRALMGLPDKELKAIQRDLAAVDKMDEVSGPIASGLNLRTLDSVKKNLDDQISKLYKSGDRYEAGVLNDLKNNLLKEIDKADATNGSYAKARSIGGDYIKVSNAMEAGKEFMKLDPEMVKKAIANSTEEEKLAFKIGVGKQLRDKIDNRVEGSNPYNAIFGSKTQKDRLKKILTPDEYRNLEQRLKAEDRLYKMRDEILGGSPTAGKQQAALEIAGQGADLAQLASGGLSAPRNAIITALKKATDGLNDNTAEQVSKILYETDPVEKMRFFTELSKNVTKEQYKKAQKAYFEVERLLPKGRSGGSIAAGSTAAQGVKPAPDELVISVKPPE